MHGFCMFVSLFIIVDGFREFHPFCCATLLLEFTIGSVSLISFLFSELKATCLPHRMES